MRLTLVFADSVQLMALMPAISNNQALALQISILQMNVKYYQNKSANLYQDPFSWEEVPSASSFPSQNAT